MQTDEIEAFLKYSFTLQNFLKPNRKNEKIIFKFIYFLLSKLSNTYSDNEFITCYPLR